jgi:hypothetical protein
MPVYIFWTVTFSRQAGLGYFGYFKKLTPRCNYPCLLPYPSTNQSLPSEQQLCHLIGERSAPASTQEVLHHPPLQPSEPTDGGGKLPVVSGHNASRMLLVAP